MSKTLHIYEGFADGLVALNNEVTSPLQVSTPVGRAYAFNKVAPDYSLRTDGTRKFGKERIYADEVHFLSINEKHEIHMDLTREFKQNPDKFGGQVYMGAAGLINLGFIAAARPAAVILFDLNMAQTFFWNDVIKALAENPKVEDFIEFLKKEQHRLPKKLKEIFHQGAKWQPHSESFLHKDKIYRGTSNLDYLFRSDIVPATADRLWIRQGYQHLHLLAKHRAIGAVTLDVTDKKSCQQLRRYLDNVEYHPIETTRKKAAKKKSTIHNQQPRRKGARVDMLYISNIFYFLKGGTDWSGRALKNATQKQARKNLTLLLKKRRAKIIHGYDQGRNLSWPRSFNPNPRYHV